MTSNGDGRRRGWRRRLRGAIAACACVLLPPAGYVGYRQAVDNFGTVVPGRVYRSDQMTGASMTRAVRAYGVKTVLNLRGPNPSAGWYRDELAASTAAGATQVDISMSSCEWMSRAQLRALVRVLDTCEYPLLIHCQWGAERTGLVSAFSELLRPGSTLDDARRQFSVGYMFLPVKDGKVMLAHLAAYEGWLRAGGRTHSPGRFREWAESGFTPGVPSREQWPYDPYPLVTVTRPAPEALAAAKARGERR
ncbi:MAG: tyrosine-protein phosphatase [Isosphaeraceae bacterium]